jgi:hypothetical protein
MVAFKSFRFNQNIWNLSEEKKKLLTTPPVSVVINRPSNLE